MIHCIAKKVKDFVLDKEVLERSMYISNCQQQSQDTTCIVENIVSKLEIIPSDVVVGNDVYNDVEFFTKFTTTSHSKTVFDMFDGFETKGGKLFGKAILSTPLLNMDVLARRMAILKGFEESYDMADESVFKMLHDNEDDVLWLFSSKEQHIEDLFNIMYFRSWVLRNMNRSPMALTFNNFYKIIVSPLIGFLSPIIYYIVPYMIIRYKFGIKIPFIMFLKLFVRSLLSGTDMIFGTNSYMTTLQFVSMLFTVFFYFQGLSNSVEISRTIYKVCAYIIGRFNGATRYLKAAQEVVSKYWNPEIVGGLVVKNDLLKAEDVECAYVNSLRDRAFSVFGNFGKQLCDYKYLDKACILSIISKSYIIDFVRASICFKRNQAASFVEYVTEQKVPVLEVANLRHPCLPFDKTVSNDFKYGEKNIIITGPNAGGKSTFIKALLINVLLSQTICVPVGLYCKLSPFLNIHSQINIPDCKGCESLFEAEMHRCHKNLKTLADTQGLSFIVMDEIFNSTNPVEGISGAYAIAKRISDYSSCLLIFTTHYVYLTKLAKTTQRFVNMRMNVRMDGENIVFPYRLERGVSKQYIALELLKKNGFEESIVDEALAIKRKLCCV